MKMIHFIIAMIALTVMQLGHATVNPKELNCLAKNIYYEAGMESEEGKVAVGMVTLNRVADGRFSDSVCGVVHQRTVLHRVKKTKVTRQIHTKKYLVVDHVEQVTEVQTQPYTTAVCQFSWNCERVKSINTNDERWTESLRVADALLQGGYYEFQDKYQEALYFHATTIKPAWRSLKKRVARIGNHVFYAEK
jgi:spore germination cell wall hydrolase CwlJ-like protein